MPHGLWLQRSLGIVPALFSAGVEEELTFKTAVMTQAIQVQFLVKPGVHCQEKCFREVAQVLPAPHRCSKELTSQFDGNPSHIGNIRSAASSILVSKLKEEVNTQRQLGGTVALLQVAYDETHFKVHPISDVAAPFPILASHGLLAYGHFQDDVSNIMVKHTPLVCSPCCMAD